jgi:hypothetical protein
MFDWNAELEPAKHRVAELEELVSRLKEALRQSTSNATEATPVDRILERARRTLPLRMASLERARHHQRFIEHKIATGTIVSKRLPYLELAETCFKAARWMPQGDAAETVRRSAAAFYTRAIALEKATPTEAEAEAEAEAKAIFADMAATWAEPPASE